jgi:extradiol dioxygenase family protein
MKRTPPSHVVIHVHARDMHEAQYFYSDALGCHEGRGPDNSMDFHLHGHHFVCHLNSALGKTGKVVSHYHPRDGQGLPVPRYALFLEMDAWYELAERLVWHEVAFIIEPSIRFEGRPEEEAIMVLLDPSGNGLEFKSVRTRRYKIYMGTT